MYNADRPITKNSEDRLDRTTFAKTLARCVLNQNKNNSFTIGLYGEYGSGKTSLFNLIQEELYFAASNLLDEEKPIILNFNPWNYSGQHQLIFAFFKRLIFTLKSSTFFTEKSALIENIELYATYFADKHLLGSSNKWLGKEYLSGWTSGEDLIDVKTKINHLLSQQKHQIIIFIDNITEINDDELREVLQIVKSIGDFSNTVYLITGEKNKIFTALNRIDNLHTEALMDKIVQMSFDIPPILKNDIDNLLTDRLIPLLEFVPEKAWDQPYWGSLYYGGVKYCFSNCRDINRYVNTLNLTYPRVKELVNPADFFALTAIEILLPGVFAGIRDNKDLFTDLLDNVYRFDDAIVKKDKMRCDEILSRTHKLDKADLLNLLMQMFPRIRHLYDSQPFFHSDALARKLKRICSPDVFDIYFRLSLKINRIPKSEFNLLISLSADPILFDQLLTRLNQDDQIIFFLDQLDEKFLKQIPEKNISTFIRALLDNGDLFPEGRTNVFQFSTAMRIHYILQILLKRIPDSQTRFLMLQQGIEQSTKSIFSLVTTVRFFSEEHFEEADTFVPHEFRLISPQDLTRLKNAVVSKIKAWSEDQRLENHPKLMQLLLAWLEWGDDKSKSYVKALTDNDKGLVKFLVSALKEPVTQAIEQNKKDGNWVMYLENINAFISSDELIPHVQQIFADNYFEKLRENEQLALMIFLDLIKPNAVKTIP